jgi:hypothetical protein
MGMNKNSGELSRIIHRAAIYLGVSILLISAFLSFDGFDGSVSGGNQAYTIVAAVIGIIFAITVSTLQFIFSSDIKGLNATLKVAGLFSYAYSIYTNKLGASHLLGMTDEMAWVVAAFCDIVAEPMIAWGIGEALVGDFIGNIMKSAFGRKEGESTYRQPDQAQNSFFKPAETDASGRISEMLRQKQNKSGYKASHRPKWDGR